MSVREREIKALQKEVLFELEESLLDHLSPAAFNGIRKLVFRSTFLAYRLGVLGPATDSVSFQRLYDTALLQILSEKSELLGEISEAERKQLFTYCLLVWLEAFRIGAFASRDRESE